MTAREFITDALREIGAFGIGEALQPDMAAVGLSRLQGLIDAWQAEPFALFLQDRTLYTIPSGTNTFTIGPSGDIDTERPTFIDGMNYINPASSPAVETVMAPMSSDQYMALSIKSLSSGLPMQFYYNPTVPLGTLFVSPTPNQAVQIAIYTERGLGIPATLNTSIVGPAGYQEGVLYQLAERLCGPFGRPMTAELRQRSASAFARMQRPNADPGMLGVDAALTSTGGMGFNVLTGTYNSSSSSR